MSDNRHCNLYQPWPAGSLVKTRECYHYQPDDRCGFAAGPCRKPWLHHTGRNGVKDAQTETGPGCLLVCS